MRRLILGPVLLSAASPASAHAGDHHGIGWTLTPSVTIPLLLALALYVVGAIRLHRRSRIDGRRLFDSQAALFLLGWLSLAGALCSPLHAAGEVSFTMHMIEHEIIMLVSTLLLVASDPRAILLWAFPSGGRRFLLRIGQWPLWRTLLDPVVATALQSAIIIAWHAPVLFDLALRHEQWHVVQHLCFLGSALIFWRAMLACRRPLVSALCLFVTSMIGGGLGALMTLSASPWYSAYADLGLALNGLTPQEDQQLAGLIMWVPGGLFHLGAAMWFLLRALGAVRDRPAQTGRSEGRQARPSQARSARRMPRPTTASGWWSR